MTVAINGAMLWQFDSVAQAAGSSDNGQPSAVAELKSVTIVAPRI